jgi:multiple sugar transport system permease protein
MQNATLPTTDHNPHPVRRWLRRNALHSIILPLGITIFLIWTLFPYDSSDFRVYFRNSAIVAVTTTLAAMAIAVFAAYALTRLRFVGREFIARTTIVTYLIPASLLFIPLFQVANQFNLTDSIWGLVIIYLIFSVPFSTWMTISYFNTVPSELQDAALVDGASKVRALFTIFIPLSLPALAVVALFTFTVAWNEFLFALLLISRDSQKTIPLGLTEFVRGDTYQWGPLMAGSLLASLPPVVVYFISQRWVVSGLAVGRSFACQSKANIHEADSNDASTLSSISPQVVGCGRRGIPRWPKCHSTRGCITSRLRRITHGVGRCLFHGGR